MFFCLIDYLNAYIEKTKANNLHSYQFDKDELEQIGTNVLDNINKVGSSLVEPAVDGNINTVDIGDKPLEQIDSSSIPRE